MKVFVSWSGERSKKIAGILCDFLAKVIQAVEPFYSPEIEKGTKWANAIDGALEGTKFGIVCLTPENLESTWIHYETGALSKTKDAVIWTFLVGLSNSDVKQPLGKFQHTQLNKEDVFNLLKSINKRVEETGGQPAQEKALSDLFDMLWDKFLKDIQDLETKDTKKKSVKSDNEIRSDRDILEEILESVRNIKTKRFIQPKLNYKKSVDLPTITPLMEEIVLDLLDYENFQSINELQATYSIMFSGELSKEQMELVLSKLVEDMRVMYIISVSTNEKKYRKVKF